MEQQAKDEILQLIPRERLSPQQKAFRTQEYARELPTYTFLREPSNFDDVDWKKYGNIEIWRGNGTIIRLSGIGYSPDYEERIVCFALDGEHKLECAIYGKTDSAIAETLTFFLSLPHSGASSVSRKLTLSSFRNANHFDFSALKPKQLALILDANPSRHYNFETGTWSAKQCVILATRPYPLNLSFSGPTGGGPKFAFKDKGTAFVAALEKRQSSFGSFSVNFVTGEAPFSVANIKRLVKLEVFDEFFTYCLDGECFYLPFFAKVNTLHYCIEAEYLRSTDFDWLDIATKDLRLTIYLDHSEEPEQLLISFLNRVAEIGHFERLDFFADILYEGYCWPWIFDKLAPIAEALINAIQRNPHLKSLDLSYTHWALDWAPHFPSIFKAMEGHPALRSFTVKKFAPNSDSADDDSEVSERIEAELDYSCLEQLLSLNRNIMVLDESGERITNGSSIDKIYSLNRFYHGSANLVKHATSSRPSLVATALVESASENFQHTALLIINHTDVLCEFITGVNVGELAVSRSASGETVSPQSIPSESNQADPAKRKAIIQPSRDVEKAARIEKRGS